MTFYTDPSIIHPGSMVLGSDGAFWFTTVQPANVGGHRGPPAIGRMTAAGVATVYAIPGARDIVGFTEGPDGAVWFADDFANTIGRITTSGVVTTYSDPAMQHPYDLVSGPEGAMWFTELGDNKIGRITTSGAVTTFAAPGAFTLAAGPDGALWFTSAGAHTIGRMTTTGALATYSDPSVNGPSDITAGPDGALWFTNYGGKSVDRITTEGVITRHYDANIRHPCGIATGPDGALWFANTGTPESIGRITTRGRVTDYTDPALDHPNCSFVTGPDDALWFTMDGNAHKASGAIGRITTPAFDRVQPAAGPPGTVVTVAGAGFAPNETVKVTYWTGLNAPSPSAARACQTISDATGDFSCTGSIATLTAGAPGAHKISAMGLTSRIRTATTFQLID